MNEDDFEGSIVLERLAEVGKVDEFFEAIDSDDAGEARSLMELANLDAATISIVLKKMNEGM